MGQWQQCSLVLKYIILCIACTSANPLWPLSLLCIWELRNEAGSYSTDIGAIIQCDWSLKMHETDRGVRHLGEEEGSWGLGRLSHCGAFGKNAAQLSFFVGQHKASVHRPKVIICWPRSPHQPFSQRHLWIDTTTVKRTSGLKSINIFISMQGRKDNLCHHKTLNW